MTGRRQRRRARSGRPRRGMAPKGAATPRPDRYRVKAGGVVLEVTRAQAPVVGGRLRVGRGTSWPITEVERIGRPA